MCMYFNAIDNLINFFVCLAVVSDEVRRLGLSESRLWTVSKLLLERKDNIPCSKTGKGSPEALAHLC